jgi:hypothetical protein
VFAKENKQEKKRENTRYEVDTGRQGKGKRKNRERK